MIAVHRLKSPVQSQTFFLCSISVNISGVERPAQTPRIGYTPLFRCRILPTASRLLRHCIKLSTLVILTYPIYWNKLCNKLYYFKRTATKQKLYFHVYLPYSDSITHFRITPDATQCHTFHALMNIYYRLQHPGCQQHCTSRGSNANIPLRCRSVRNFANTVTAAEFVRKISLLTARCKKPSFLTVTKMNKVQ